MKEIIELGYLLRGDDDQREKLDKRRLSLTSAIKQQEGRFLHELEERQRFIAECSSSYDHLSSIRDSVDVASISIANSQHGCLDDSSQVAAAWDAWVKEADHINAICLQQYKGLIQRKSSGVDINHLAGIDDCLVDLNERLAESKVLCCQIELDQTNATKRLCELQEQRHAIASQLPASLQYHSVLHDRWTANITQKVSAEEKLSHLKAEQDAWRQDLIEIRNINQDHLESARKFYLDLIVQEYLVREKMNEMMSTSFHQSEHIEAKSVVMKIMTEKLKQCENDAENLKMLTAKEKEEFRTAKTLLKEMMEEQRSLQVHAAVCESNSFRVKSEPLCFEAECLYSQLVEVSESIRWWKIEASAVFPSYSLCRNNDVCLLERKEQLNMLSNDIVSLTFAWDCWTRSRNIQMQNVANWSVLLDQKMQAVDEYNALLIKYHEAIMIARKDVSIESLHRDTLLRESFAAEREADITMNLMKENQLYGRAVRQLSVLCDSFLSKKDHLAQLESEIRTKAAAAFESLFLTTLRSKVSLMHAVKERSIGMELSRLEDLLVEEDEAFKKTLSAVYFRLSELKAELLSNIEKTANLITTVRSPSSAKKHDGLSGSKRK
eukprot:scaffold14367_cov250-Ochromonas_danica.AAC.32